MLGAAGLSVAAVAPVEPEEDGALDEVPDALDDALFEAPFGAAVVFVAGLSLSPEPLVPAILIPTIAGDAKSPRAKIPTANTRITSSLKFNFRTIFRAIASPDWCKSLVQKSPAKDS